jgi:L-iditol 2-dehydrogenase
MKKVFVDGVGKLPVVREVEIPEINDQEMLVKVKAASICNLTDVHTIEGSHPPHHVWAEGYFKTPSNAWPAPLGHEGAGEIVKVGKYVTNEFKPGDRVCTVHASDAMSEYIKVRPEWVAKLPDCISYEEAAPLEMLAWINVLVEDTVHIGDRVVILGQGASGLMATQCAKLAGARKIIVTEPVAEKRKISLRLGADIALDPSNQNIVERILEMTSKEGADTVIECVGKPSTIGICTQLLKHRHPSFGMQPGTISIFGACPGMTAFDFFELHFKGGKVMTSGSSRIGYTKYGLLRAVDIVTSGQAKMRSLLTHKFYIDEVDKAFKLLMDKKEPSIKVIIVPDKDYLNNVKLSDEFI